MKKNFLIYVLLYFSFSAFSVNWEKIESYELQPLQFNQKINILSEIININDSKTEVNIEMEAKKISQKEVECTIICEPMGYGRLYTDMLIPYGFEISLNNQQVDYYIINNNKKYTSEEAKNTKGITPSEIHFKVKLNNKKNKLILNYYNRNYQSQNLIHKSRLIYMKYNFINNMSKKKIIVYNLSNDLIVNNIYQIQNNAQYQYCNLQRNQKNNFIQWESIIANNTDSVILGIEGFSIDLSDFSLYGQSYETSKNFQNDILIIEDLFFLSKEQLAILRNSIYATHGYNFKNPKWKEYFTENFYGYKINPNFSESDFTDIEKKNLELIKYMENTTDTLLLSDFRNLEEDDED